MKLQVFTDLSEINHGLVTKVGYAIATIVEYTLLKVYKSPKMYICFYFINNVDLIDIY